MNARRAHRPRRADRGGVNPQNASGRALHSRVVPWGFVRGVLIALLSLGMIALTLLLLLEGHVGEAIVAVGTLALALATAVLALATFALVRTTAVELDLLRQQTTAMTEQAAVARAQLTELRETRFADLLPVLHWQLHPPGGRQTAMYLEDSNQIGAALVLTNVGPGPARLTSLQVGVRDHPDETFTAHGLVAPSTLPAGERIELALWSPYERQTAIELPMERDIELDLMYADIANMRHYQTKPSVHVRWSRERSLITRLDADDLSPDEREWDDKMQARWGDQGRG
jgi:hypothetical protein